MNHARPKREAPSPIAEPKTASKAGCTSCRHAVLAAISHELRNPLAALSNSLYVLRRTPAGEARAVRAAEVMERQVRQLSTLISRLTDVADLDRGLIQLRRSTVDLSELVRDVGLDYEAVFLGRDVQIRVQAPAAPVYVEGDPARLVQVLGHLLDNAVRFTPRGGHVLVTLEVDAHARVARIRVKDSGVGLDDRLLQMLFEPFVQSDASLARSQGGLGLGLSTVKGLVELHGGCVRAESEGSDRGSTFFIELPLAGQHAEATRPAFQERCTPRRVLVIEPNPASAGAMRALLEQMGSTVDVAGDGRKGVALTLAHCPDVVFADLSLPDMDGYTLARLLQDAIQTRHTLLVSMSTASSSEERTRAVEVGYHEHMNKPATLPTLQRILSHAAPPFA